MKSIAYTIPIIGNPIIITVINAVLYTVSYTHSLKLNGGLYSDSGSGVTILGVLISE